MTDLKDGESADDIKWHNACAVIELERTAFGEPEGNRGRTFEIEQYEIHTQLYRIEAESEAEAVKRLFDGEASAVDNGQEFIEVANDVGLPVEEYRELANELRRLGESIGKDVIPSIRAIERTG